MSDLLHVSLQKQIVQGIDCMEHQALFMMDEHRYVADVGGFGCGKSYGVGMKTYRLAYVNMGYDGMLISRTGTQLKKLLIEVFKVFRAMGLRMYDKDYKKFVRDAGDQSFMLYDGNQLVIKWSATLYTTIWLGTTENGAYEKWAGGNMAFAVIDEIDTMMRPEEVWRYANDRVRVKAPLLQTACASTPEGYGFLWDFFENQPLKNPSLTDRAIIRGCTLDSPYLDKSYVLNQIRTRDPFSMRAYIYGEFVNLDGALVYWAFKKDKHATHLKWENVPHNAIIYVGVDFNKNINACNLSFVQHGKLYTVKEIYGCKGTHELIIELNKVLKGRQFYIYPDATNFEAIQQLERAYGEEAIVFTPGNPRVPFRVASVNQALVDGRVFVNPDECPHLWSGLLRQTKNAKGDPDKTKGLDHSLDGEGYKICHLMPIEDSTGYVDFGAPSAPHINSIGQLLAV